MGAINFEKLTKCRKNMGSCPQDASLPHDQ